METVKLNVHIEGLDREPFAAIRDTNYTHNSDKEQTGSECHCSADVASEKTKDEGALSEKQAECGGHFSADRESGTVERGEVLSECAVPSAAHVGLDCDDSQGSETGDHGNNWIEHGTNIEAHDDSMAASGEVGTPTLRKPNNSTTTSAGGLSRFSSASTARFSLDQPCGEKYCAQAGDPSQDLANLRDTSTKWSQGQLDSAYANVEASDTSEEQHHSSSSSSSSRTNSSFEDCSDPMCETCVSAQVAQYDTGSDTKTIDSAPEVLISSNADSIVKDHNAQIQAKADTHAETRTSRSVDSEGPPPLELNYEALKHVATYFLPGSHGACIDIAHITGGSFHEIRVLTCQDGWSCIGRFTRVHEPLFKTESELATIAYVREHTPVPVPEIYFVNHNHNHVVGAAFVLMERLIGCSLDDIWRELSLEHQLFVAAQIAQVVGELASLRFDSIGSLTSGGTVGPLLNISSSEHEELAGPFDRFFELACGTFDETRRHAPKGAIAMYSAIKNELQDYLAGEEPILSLQSPYRLIHADLQNRNILVTREDKSHAPKITGIIDWDWAFVGPAYYLYEHNEEFTDYQESDMRIEVKLLRKCFVKTLKQCFPKGSSERELVKRAFREKSVELTDFLRFAKYPFDDPEQETRLTKGYLHSFDRDDPHDYRHPYGVLGEIWVPDLDTESDDE
jgi:hypothetical protein